MRICVALYICNFSKTQEYMFILVSSWNILCFHCNREHIINRRCVLIICFEILELYLKSNLWRQRIRCYIHRSFEYTQLSQLYFMWHRGIYANDFGLSIEIIMMVWCTLNVLTRIKEMLIWVKNFRRNQFTLLVPAGSKLYKPLQIDACVQWIYSYDRKGITLILVNEPWWRFGSDRKNDFLYSGRITNLQ